MIGIRGIGAAAPGIAQANTASARSAERLASGKRINRAADDPAALATVQQFLAIEASVAQGEANFADAASVAAVADGALDSSSDLLGRMRELSVQAQNGTLSDSDRAAIQQEFDALGDEVSRVAASTDFAGKKLLDGSFSGSFEDGLGGPNPRLDIGDHSAAALGIAGLSADASATLSALDAARDQVSSSRAKLGATTRRLDHAGRALGQTREAVTSARSRIGDTDIAAETAKLARSRTLRRLGVNVLRHGQDESGALLDLLR